MSQDDVVFSITEYQDMVTGLNEQVEYLIKLIEKIGETNPEIYRLLENGLGE